MCVWVEHECKAAETAGELAEMLGCGLDGLKTYSSDDGVPEPEYCLCSIDVEASAEANGFEVIDYDPFSVSIRRKS